MKDNDYINEGMDIKKYMLCLWRRLPLVVAAGVAAAVLFGAVYTLSRTVPEEERTYQAFAKVYLDFAADETGEVYQAYNGYTWNDLMAADPIMERVLSYLPADYDREEAEEAIRAEILSDIRLLTVTVATNRQERTEAILHAAVQALADYGEQAKEFLGINAIQETEARLVVADDRLLQVVLLGLFLGLFFALLGVALRGVFEARILLAGDLKKVTDVSFIGYAGAAGKFGKDYENNLAYLRKKAGDITVCEASPDEPFSEEDFENLRGAAGVVLSVPFAKASAAWVTYAVDQLAAQDCVLLGVAIRETDEKFLKRYYGKKVLSV
ncbi:MAG: hypothetical protein NC302_12405 [Bacteroidales bacterium]|nr:hypothetical protein [Bacteroidales bacterium]MCM1423732.1 hypothetical protein [bacterium]